MNDIGPEIQEVTKDVACACVGNANIVFVGEPQQAGWVLIDTGAAGQVQRILDIVSQRFGGKAPECILLTHAHHDHIGCLTELVDCWSVPVFAHPFEVPGLPKGEEGESPHWLRLLPSDGSVPTLSDWEWLYTPGHSAGHVCFWRERDGLLLAGDAFLTTSPDSAYGEWSAPALHGPPLESTTDWAQAGESVRRLAELSVQKVLCGHGHLLPAQEVAEALHELAANFEDRAVPPHE